MSRSSSDSGEEELGIPPDELVKFWRTVDELILEARRERRRRESRIGRFLRSYFRWAEHMEGPDALNCGP